MSNNEQISALLAQLNQLTKNGGEAVAVAPQPALEPTPVVVAPMQATILEQGSAMAAALTLPTVAPKTKKSAPVKGKWVNHQLQLANGDRLEIRVAPKGYGTVGFATASEYVNFYGYRERMEALCALFGDGFRTNVFDWMVANGLRNRVEVVS